MFGEGGGGGTFPIHESGKIESRPRRTVFTAAAVAVEGLSRFPAIRRRPWRNNREENTV